MNTVLNAMEKAYGKIPPKLIDCLYLFAFALVLVYDFCFLTRFDREPFRVPYMLGAALAGIVLVLRLLNVKNENKVGLVFAAMILFIGGSYLLVRHSFYFLVLAMLIVGALRVKDNNIITVYVLVTTLFFAFMFLNYIISNPEWKDSYQKHFGSINTTDCQGMIFFILSAFLFLRRDRVRYIELIVLAAIVLWFWYYTRADINMYCALACSILTGLMIFGKALGLKGAQKPCQIIGYIVSTSFLICAVIMIVLAIRFDPEQESWRAVNELLHQRLETPHRMIGLYPLKLWGSEFVQVGYGYEPGVRFVEQYAKYGYTYIDSSYPNILINHGYLIFALIMGTMTVVSCRYARKGDLFRVLILAVIAVNCAAEGHLKELSCNVWLVLLFAAIGKEPNLRIEAGTKEAADAS